MLHLQHRGRTSLIVIDRLPHPGHFDVYRLRIESEAGRQTPGGDQRFLGHLVAFAVAVGGHGVIGRLLAKSVDLFLGSFGQLEKDHLRPFFLYAELHFQPLRLQNLLPRFYKIAHLMGLVSFRQQPFGLGLVGIFDRHWRRAIRRDTSLHPVHGRRRANTLLPR